MTDETTATTTETTTTPTQQNARNNNQTGTILIQLNQQQHQIELMQQALISSIHKSSTLLKLHCNSMFSIVNQSTLELQCNHHEWRHLNSDNKPP
jgi:hypothetical protein